VIDDLAQLAQLLRQWNEVGDRIASLIGRPAEPGHIAEFVAARIFSIDLHQSAAHKGSDGVFVEGPLSGRTVNVKWSSKQDNLLNLNPASPPDYYLVLKGPKAPPQSSRGRTHPWLISFVYLFEANLIHSNLASRGVAVGVASSVVADLWQRAQVYPSANNLALSLTHDQRAALSLFAEGAGT
jgi:hypothetical protein